MLTASARVRRPEPRWNSSAPPLGSSLYMFRKAAIGLICLLLLPAVQGQGGFTDPRSNICLFDNHKTIVVGETLFVDGGEWASDSRFHKDNGTASEIEKWQNEYLWKLDLKKPFSTRSPPWELEEKPSSPDAHYNGAEGTIWNVGMGTFITIGGWFPLKHGPVGDYYGAPYLDKSQNFKLPDARMFTYDVKNKTWSSELLDMGVRRISTASWVSNERLRRGYVLGGVYIIEESTGLPNPFTDTWLDTMTQYDFRKKEWKTKHVPDGIGKTVDGGLIALDRVGEDGVLLFLGGKRRDDNGASGSATFVRRSMKTIWVYDIKSSIWYEQVTTGEIPVGRRQSCFFMVPAPDLSSYQIYTFSGTMAEEITLLDLYVLTVPGFIWKKISLTDAEYPDTYPINAHQCSPHKAGRQFLIVPENMNASRNTTTFTYHCNNGTGIKVFDTLEWKFKPEFDPTLTTLGVPKPVIDLIGGTTSGGASVTAPKGGWQAKSLGTIFEKRNEPVMYDDEVSSPKPRPTNSVSKGAWVGIGVGAWVGIGVGALIGLICLICLFYWWRCAFRGGKDEENPRPAELYAQQDPVEAQGYTVRQELCGGYHLPELLRMQESKVAYLPNPGEYQQHLGQEHGSEGGPGVDPAGGAVAVSSLVGTIKLGSQIHVHQQGVYEDEPPISYEESMQGTQSPYQGGWGRQAQQCHQQHHQMSR